MDGDKSIICDFEDESLVVNDDDEIAFLLSLQSQYAEKSNPSEVDQKIEDFLSNLDKDLDYAFAAAFQDDILYSPKDKSKDSTKKNAAVVPSTPKPLSIVDHQWELIDPHPDIHALFQEYDKKFFYGKLVGVEVRWSPRMTLCAGVCCYEGRGGLCSVRLSVPLLKLRPRRDLIETLLHEMIHAYLFVTHNNKDRDGHGPEFLSHMNRINKETGTRITVYHSFHDEVDLYRQHWWKCTGPCKNRPPFYGLVKRAMNRAPGPNDPWWADHKASCNGEYIKIKEPENYKKKSSKRKAGVEADKSQSNIQNFLKKVAPNSQSENVNQPLTTSKRIATISTVNQNKKTNDLENSKTSSKKTFLPFVAPSAHTNNSFNQPLTKSKKITTISTAVQNKRNGVPKGSKTSLQKLFVPFKGTGHTLGGTSSKVSNHSVLLDTFNRASTSNSSNFLPENFENFSSSTPSKLLEINNKGITGHSSNINSVPCCSKPPGTSNKLLQHPINNYVTSEKLPVTVQKENIRKISPKVLKNDDVEIVSELITCPVCSKAVELSEINSHLDSCIQT